MMLRYSIKMCATNGAFTHVGIHVCVIFIKLLCEGGEKKGRRKVVKKGVMKGAGEWVAKVCGKRS